MSLVWSEDLKQSIASLCFVGAGLVLSDLQQLVVTAFLYNLHLIKTLLFLRQSNETCYSFYRLRRQDAQTM